MHAWNKILSLFIILFLFSLNLKAQNNDTIDLFTLIENSAKNKTVDSEDSRNLIKLNDAVLKTDGIGRDDIINFKLGTLTSKFKVLRKESYYQDTHSILAKGINDEQSHLTLSVHGNKIQGKVHLFEERMVYHLGNDQYNMVNYVEKVDPNKLDIISCSTGDTQRVTNSNVNISNESYSNNRLEDLTSNSSAISDVDYMIVYTQAALDWINNNGTTLNLVIAESFNNSVLVLDNSNIDVTLDLVKTHKTNFDETGRSAGEILRHLTSSSIFNPWGSEYEGLMDEVHNLRYEYGADLVTMFAKIDDTGGIGWLLNNTSGWPVYGFTLNRVQQVQYSYTLIHELGHNFGNAHSRNQNSNPATSEGGLFDYSTGWRLEDGNGNGYATVMTYAEGDQRIPYFSNPNISYESIPTGSYSGTYAPADNARSMNEIRNIIANYSNSQVAIQVNPSIVNFESEDTFKTININSFTDWDVIYPQDSFAFLANSSYQQIFNGSGNMEVKIITSDNPTTEPREEDIILRTSDGSQEVQLTIRQKGASVDPPATPQLSGPSDGATGQPLTLTLDWSSVSGADNYDVQVSPVSDFSSLVVDQTESETQHAVADGKLSHETKYYWRVRASNEGGNSSWSTTWDFTTEPVDPPATPQLSGPSDGATGQPLTLTLDWSSVSGADNYDVQVSPVSDFSSLVVDQTESETQHAVADGKLSYEKNYYWRVRASNEGGNSSWSTTWDFTTEQEPVDPPSTTPNLTSPSDGATSQPLTLTLDWESVSGADNYDVQVSPVSDFSSLVVDQTESETQHAVADGKLSHETKYYWRVRASNEGGNSSWSTTWDFTTEQEPVDPPSTTPNLTSPSDGATSQPLTLTLDWESVSGADNYDVQVSPVSDFSSLVVDQTESETQHAVADGKLSHETKYYWRVRASNEGGNSSWSNAWDFTTIDGSSPKITVTTPSSGDVWQAGSEHTVSWTSSNVSGSVDIELHNSNGQVADIAMGTNNDGSEPWTVGSSLSAGTDYRVAITSSADPTVGDTSGTFEITDNPNKPPIVSIDNGPPAGGTIDFNDPGFVWSGNDSDGSISVYEVELQGPSSTGFSTTDTFYQFSGLADGTYTFRVRAQDNDGEYSSWAERIFTVATGDPILPDPQISLESLPGSITLGESIAINSTVENAGGDSPTGGITYSFPDMTGSTDKQYVSSNSSTNTDSYDEFVAGETINGRTGQISANYLMVEGGETTWNSSTDRTLSVNVTPQQAGTFRIYVRSAMQGEDGNWYNEPSSSSTSDQQSWPVYVYTVKVNESPKPPIVEYSSGWNLISIPIEVKGKSLNDFFNSIVSADHFFAFNKKYSNVSLSASISNGKGYWVKLDGAETVEFNGTHIQNLTINLDQGWNLVGATAETLAVPSDIQDPSNIIENSTVWENSFNSSTGEYELIEASEMVPGKGYFIKATQSGQITLSKQ